jgi:hypothetical protein
MSERRPSSRSARVMESRARAQAERAEMDADARARLERELKIDGSFSQARLIDTAVSCSVEISVISKRFVRCCATSEEMSRLQVARGQLARALKLLGLTEGRSGADPDPMCELASVAAEIAERKGMTDGD